MKRLVYLFAVLVLGSCGTRNTKPESPDEQLKVVAVNYPLHYFAQRIAGDLVRIDYMIPEDVDPAYWVPGDSALQAFQGADIILANGADYAKWLHNVSLPESRITYSLTENTSRLIEVQSMGTHSHGPEGEHEHTGFAFTTWLDFELAAQQALAVKDVFAAKLPEHTESIENNFESLRSDLQGLHTSMLELGPKLHDVGILASHPVYQYLDAAYHLHIHSVHFEPGEMPDSEQWHDFEHLIEHSPAKLMLWEGEPHPEVKEILQEKGIAVVLFNPCGNKPAQGDFIKVMNQNVETLKSFPSP